MESDHETAAAEPIENLSKQPPKSILKKTSHVDPPNLAELAEHSGSGEPRARFDEMNILATLHPENKDYGFMKINEPKTPYSGYSDTEEDAHGSTGEGLADSVKEQIAKKRNSVSITDNEDSDEELTEEEKKRREEFDKKRKMHYSLEASHIKHPTPPPEDEEDNES